jgi:phosphopantetheinyl transferase (holo-ACP synthase)
MLWNHLAARKNPLWMRDESKDGRVFPFRVARGLLGKPRLLWGEYPGPAVSFSQSGDKRWAALCGDGFDIGIDVAESRDFRGAYPFNRVFHPQELAHALKLAGNDLEEASALLWSIKEAFVKALGCGFHLVDPKQIMVDPTDGPPLREKNAHAFSVSLLERAASRFPVFKDRFLQARSFCFGKMWLSIALLHRRDGCDPEQRSLNTRNPWRQRRN